MTRKNIFALLLLLLVGCQRETFEWMDDNRPNPDGSVRFRLQTDDAEIETDESQTRGTPRDSLEKYDSVFVNVYSHINDYEPTGDDVEFYQAVKLKKDDLDWKATPPLFWPKGQKLSFFSYTSDIIPFADAGISFSPATGVPENIIYRVPTDVTKQPDLLVSTKLNQPQAGSISLTMKHALACVSFCGVAPEKGTRVKSIALRNVYGEGTLALKNSTIEWVVTPESKGITVYEAGINENQELGKDPLPEDDYLMTADGYLMMIPQTLANAAIDVLYWNGKNEEENKVITYILPVDDDSYKTWKPGQKYIYKFGNQSDEDIMVVYYEKYSETEYGLYYHDKGALQYSIKDKAIEEAGYGVLSKKSIDNQTLPIRLVSSASTPVTSEPVIELKDIGFLYRVSQSGKETFALPASSTPVDVYFNNSNKSCGMIVPHFAKGVYTVQTPTTAHAIRTPQQMRNITALGKSPIRNTHTYTQELDLDFSKEAIGGGTLTTAVVNCEFNDRFKGKFEEKNKRIENVTIRAFTAVNGALFQTNSGEINEVALVNSSILSGGNAAGIAAINNATGTIIKPRVIGESLSTPVKIEGTAECVGAIVGKNWGTITGNTDIEEATEIPVAEVSGWVTIKGLSAGTGGIVGENSGTITTCLVNGVHVKGTGLGNAEIAKITIEGGHYVGGIVGVNQNQSNIIGNHSKKNGAEPDVAGVVSVSGTNFIGGIAGENRGTLNEVNIRLGRGGETDATFIKGSLSVGGIVGRNTGTLQAEGSFISVRGNIRISGESYIGGIVGNNEGGDISNCFVYKFFNQEQSATNLVHYAPKITGESRVGGIVGSAGEGKINNCAVFSTVSTDNANGGNAANAVVEIKASAVSPAIARSVGGIVGHGLNGLNITNCYVLGNVKVEGVANGVINSGINSGGIVGENDPGTEITSVHIGNSNAKVVAVYEDLFFKIGLPVRDWRMQTNGKVMTKTSGTPTIIGKEYVGGICGVNWGTVEWVLINDNVNIGEPTSTYVGGISGGNGINGSIKNCKTYNDPANTSAEVIITGTAQVGGIVGINNGSVQLCQLGLKGLNSSRLITIQGATNSFKFGGIAGSNGGAETGNEYTLIKDCYVYGKVHIKADNFVGGILGENGQKNKVVNCSVIGYAFGNNTNLDGYDVRLNSAAHVGGIAGANFSEICGTKDSYNTVTNTAIRTNYMYAGGLVGFQQSTTKFPGKLYYCDVSRGVLIHHPAASSGAFVGQLDGEGGTSSSLILFGTTLKGITNRIYIGTGPDRVVINGNDGKVILPPLTLPEFYPETTPPFEPDTSTGNLWTRYLPYNYLHYTTYDK